MPMARTANSPDQHATTKAAVQSSSDERQQCRQLRPHDHSAVVHATIGRTVTTAVIKLGAAPAYGKNDSSAIAFFLTCSSSADGYSRVITAQSSTQRQNECPLRTRVHCTVSRGQAMTAPPPLGRAKMCLLLTSTDESVVVSCGTTTKGTLETGMWKTAPTSTDGNVKPSGFSVAQELHGHLRQLSTDEHRIVSCLRT